MTSVKDPSSIEMVAETDKNGSETIRGEGLSGERKEKREGRKREREERKKKNFFGFSKPEYISFSDF